jgi:hypothetical protein
LEQKWGTRKIRDNWKRLSDNYVLWKSGQNRKYNVEILVVLTNKDAHQFKRLFYSFFFDRKRFTEKR